VTAAPGAPANNFNVIRLLAAWLVLFSHSYHLTGCGAAEPLFALSGGRMTCGTLSVAALVASPLCVGAAAR
jgi:hypothetical protein